MRLRSSFIIKIVPLILMLFSFETLLSQNNPYKIKDNIYKIFEMVNKVKRGTNRQIHLVDSMYLESRHEGDTKAQCIALFLKVNYYANCIPYNEPAHRKSVEDAKSFIINTPFLQYYFGCWNSLITHFYNIRQYDKALIELKSYQEEALKYNNSYGISFSYKNLGHLYSLVKSYSLAIEQFRKGAEYLESINDMKEIYSFYNSLGLAYMETGDMNKAGEYYKKALASSKTDAQLLYSYQSILNWSIVAHQPVDVVDKYHNDYVKYQYANARLLEASHCNVEYRYYKYKNDKANSDKWFHELLKHPMSINENSLIADWYAENKDFEKAYGYQLKDSHQKDSLLNSNISQITALYSAQYDNAQLLLSQKQLELENSQIKVQNQNFQLQGQQLVLEKMSSEQQFLLTSREKDSLIILSAREYHRADSIQNEKTLQEAQNQMEDAQQREKYQNNIINMISAISLLIVAGGAIFIYQMRHKNRRLNEEKRVAQEAQRVSEETKKELAKALEVAKRADRLKGQFLNNMSHEIRTPLNAIVGFTSLLNGEDGYEMSEEERGELLKLVQTNSTLLTTLINDLLDLSRLQSGNYKIDYSKASLRKICLDSMASVTDRVPQGVVLSMDKRSADDITIDTDVHRTMQVLINYLTNACKYTAQGSITVGYTGYESDGKEWVDITVEDTGSGIPADKADEIFNRFEKLDEFKQGTGLGLNICKTIADLLHGKVWLDTSYTKGCRFVFSLPQKQKKNQE